MFLSIVYFITGLLGFLTLTVVIAQYGVNRKVNFYFLVLLFIISFRFFFNGVYVLIPFSFNEDLGLIFRSFGTAVFPCVYLYFKNVIRDKKNATLDELRYFIVPVLFAFSNILAHIYTPFLNFYFYFLFVAIALFYLFISFLKLKKELWFKKSKYTIIERQRILLRNWTFFFYTFSVLIITRLMVTILLDIYVAGFSNGTNCLWISAIISCCLFFKVLLANEWFFNQVQPYNQEKAEIRPELIFHDFWVLSDEIKINNVHDLKLKEIIDRNLKTYVYEVERVALKEFCFRKSSVTLGDFAIQLKIPKSHLIYFFKYHCTISFVDFKKIVRIYDAISLIESGFLKLGGVTCLSKKTGFSSHNVFLTCFKEITGVDPQEYNKLNKAM